MSILYYYDSKDLSCFKASWLSAKLATEEALKEFDDDDGNLKSQISTLSLSLSTTLIFFNFTVLSRSQATCQLLRHFGKNCDF